MIPSISTLPLVHLASGDRLWLQVYKFIGAHPGKKAYIQANLHGAEIAGNGVIYQLMELLKALAPDQLRGEIWLVPVCNPLGTNQRTFHFATGRFNPYDGRDWNRIFWDYEKEGEDLLSFAKAHLDQDIATIQQHYRQQILSRFAKLADAFERSPGVPFSEQYRYLLQSLCLNADYVIDLHTSADQSIDYLYYFPRRDAIAHTFQLSAGIMLDIYDGDAFDESFIKPWLALEQCFADLGRSLQFDIDAWTLELGPTMQLQPQAVERGLRGVKNYLAHKGILTLEGFPLPSAPAMPLTNRSQVVKYYAPVGGMVQSRVALGTRVEAGQWLYQLLSFNKVGELPTQIDVIAEQAGLVFDVAIAQTVNQGEYILSLL